MLLRQPHPREKDQGVTLYCRSRPWTLDSGGFLLCYRHVCRSYRHCQNLISWHGMSSIAADQSFFHWQDRAWHRQVDSDRT